MKKILFIFGTRPEAIKLAPIILEFRARGGAFIEICVSAQHREMLDMTMKCFALSADYDLDIMKDSQDLFDIDIGILSAIKAVLTLSKPDIVVVQGDTSTAFMAALGAFYFKIPVCHIEAGLRTYDKYHPFPEEINRALISQIASYHCAPSPQNRRNLIKENISKHSIKIVGNSVIDALKITLDRFKRDKSIETRIIKTLRFQPPPRFVLVTCHRRESFGEAMKNIANALAQIATRIDIIYPLHPNPSVASIMRESLSQIPRIHLINPLDYEGFVWVMAKSYCILTDSGGISEEATFLHKPTLILREKTERNDGVKCGTLRLIGTKKERIIKETLRLLDSKKHYAKMANPRNALPYGDGNSSRRIYKFLMKHL